MKQVEAPQMQGSNVTLAGGSAAGLQGVDGTGSTQAASRRTAETAGAQTSTAVDQASLSSAGGLVASLTGDSDVRLDKVASLKAAIDAGTYNVPSGDVADKLIENLLG